MFCAVFDALGKNLDLLAIVVSNQLQHQQQPPAQLEADRDRRLQITHFRYTCYLDLLVIQIDNNRPKEQWPLPPW
jgi:hypothetical protein